MAKVIVVHRVDTMAYQLLDWMEESKKMDKELGAKKIKAKKALEKLFKKAGISAYPLISLFVLTRSKTQSISIENERESQDINEKGVFGNRGNSFRDNYKSIVSVYNYKHFSYTKGGN